VGHFRIVSLSANTKGRIKRKEKVKKMEKNIVEMENVGIETKDFSFEIEIETR
jgi:hypothetical protein